jgi:hypothetical protein
VFSKNFTGRQVVTGVVTALLITLFYLFFNLNYLSDWRDERGDTTTYDYYVKLGIPRFLFNPHHLFYEYTGLLMYEKAKEAGYTGSSMRIQQLRNLVISSVCLGIIFFLFYRVSGRFFLSLLIIGTMAFCCAVWIYAQINDTGLLHSILLFLLFFTACAFPFVKRKYLYACFLGIFHSIVIFFHQSDALFVVVVFFIIVFTRNCYRPVSNIRTFPLYVNREQPTLQKPFIRFSLKNFRFFFVYLICLIIIVGAAYYYIGIVVLNLTLNPAEAEEMNRIKGATYFFNWIVLYTNIDYWGKGFVKSGLFQKVIEGITSYFYQKGEWEGETLVCDFNAMGLPHTVLPNLVVLFVSGILLLTIVLFIPLYKKYHYIFIAALLFLVIYTIFSCFWEPDYREFWIASMFAFWFLTFLVLNLILDKVKRFWPLPQVSIYLFLTIFMGLLFFFNFRNLMYVKASREFRAFDIVADNKVWGRR